MLKSEIKNLSLIIAFFFAVLVISLVFGLLTEKVSLIKLVDEKVYSFFRSIPRLSITEVLIWPFDNNFLPVFRPHPSFLVVLYGSFLVYLAIFKRSLLPWAILALVMATFMARIILQVDTALFFRERPYTALPNDVVEEVRNSLKGWTSYPSGHTRDTALYATIISFFLPKTKYLMVLLVLFVGFSRMYLGIHYFTDVLAGALIGISVGYLTILLLRMIQRIRKVKPIV